MTLRLLSRSALPALLCAVLSACGTATLDVDLTTGGAFEADRLKARLAAVELLDDHGDLHRLDLATDDALDLLDYRDGGSFRLAEAAEVTAGHYTGFRLRLDSPVTLRLLDGSEYLLTTTDDGPFFPLDLDLETGDSESLIAVLDLRFSLADHRAQSGRYDFAPVLAVYPADTGASVQGAVTAALLDAAGCRDGSTLRAGTAVYAFAGRDATPSDYASDRSPNPIASTLLSDDDGSYSYALPALAAGPYTLALTCSADADEADSANGLVFGATRSITLDDGDAATLDFRS